MRCAMAGTDYLLVGARCFESGGLIRRDVAISGGKVVSSPQPGFCPEVLDLPGCIVLPAFADVHVHFREPGYEYKETIATGAAAALAGGCADVFTMPNLNPPPDSPATLRPQLDAIANVAAPRIHPFGAITAGRKGRKLADLEALAPFVAGFSDDGSGVQDAALMREAMLRAKALGKPLTAHCEVDSLLVPGGCVHDGDWAREHGFAGISSASEWRMVERDLDLVRETHCAYHVCHVSTKESVALIRAAKADGLPVTCETAPHYLLLCDADLRDEGRFKMNPPVRSRADRDALLAGLCDGTVDCIATDHAPHAAAEKEKGLAGSAFGIVGLETAFALVYTYLVKPGTVPLGTVIDRMAVRPRRIFGGTPASLADGAPADFAVFDVSGSWTVDPSAFLSKGKATPFAGWEVSARAVLTLVDGVPAFRRLPRKP